jgi:hypothetical protein
MTLTQTGDDLLCSLGYNDILTWSSLYIGQSGEYLYGYDYQKLLRDAVLNKSRLVNVYVRLAAIVKQRILGTDVVEVLAELFAFNYNMPHFKSLTHWEFLG